MKSLVAAYQIAAGDIRPVL